LRILYELYWEIDIAAHPRTWIPALLLLSLSGCTEWVHRTKPPSQLAIDDADCRMQAIDKIANNPQQQTAAKWATRAGGTPSYYIDANESLREQWHTSCLRKMGWFMRIKSQQEEASTADSSGRPVAYGAGGNAYGSGSAASHGGRSPRAPR
jgi:hypothetical protein